MNERIQSQHLSRKAILYVRQSSMMQVHRNQESQRLQYAMQDRLHTLGWVDVMTIDEDLGKSAAGHADRTGFEKMISQVCLGDVGVVAAREMSRFARNSREWQRLIEMCRVVDTLLIDQETVYDARRGNDRLLLGLKGSLNEYELDVLRLRSAEARREKARRGELVVAAPAGYVVSDDSRIEMDPDLRVQEMIALVFRKFSELGSIRQTLLWFQGESLELPVRRYGPRGSQETLWRSPRYPTVHRILTDPIYAGTYRYGRTQQLTTIQDGQPEKKLRRRARSDWLAEIDGQHAAYISKNEFESNQVRIAENTNVHGGVRAGAARRGPALLVGLLRCLRCGKKLTIAYSGGGRIHPRYVCRRGSLDCGEAKCISVGAPGPDQAVAVEILRVLEPQSLEAARLVVDRLREKASESERALSLEIEAARFEMERARRQYDAVDPANRLVASELERRWNDRLTNLRMLEERLVVMGEERPSRLPGEEDLQRLALNVRGIWDAPTTDAALQKRIIRTLIREILIDTDGKQGQTRLVIHWKGGVHTELMVQRRRRGDNVHTDVATVEAVRMLARVLGDAGIAGVLNRHDLKTGRGNRWTKERVASLRLKRKIGIYNQERCHEAGWLNLTNAARFLGVSQRTLRLATERGEITGLHPLPYGPWIFDREDLQGPGAIALKQRAEAKRDNEAAAIPDPDQLTLFTSSTCPGGTV